MKTRKQRFAESRWFPALTALLYLVLAGLLFYLISARTRDQIEALLTQLVPKVLWVNFLLILIAVLLCGRDIAKAFRGLLNRQGLWLLLIVAAGLLLVSQVAPQVHRIYYDEDIYANMAQNIAYTGQMGMANYGSFEYGEYFVNWLLYNKDPGGWPFLISLVFQLFGTDETFAFYLNNLLFAGGILVVFFIARIFAGGAPFPSLLAALVYALIPHNLLWANTISAENAAAVFGGIAVLCALVWLRTRAARHLFLLAAVLPFACNMRPESALIAFWVFAAAVVNLFADGPNAAAVSAVTAQGSRGGGEGECAPGRVAAADFRHPFATRSFWAMGLIAFALIIPLVLHFYAMAGQSWGAEGAKFATSFFTKNVAVNGPYYFNNKEFPVLFTLLSLIGLAVWKRRRWIGAERRQDAPRGQNAGQWQGAERRQDRPQGQKAGQWQGEERRQDGRRADGRSALLMLLWFLLFWLIFLFFYAGSYKYGADVRFALLCFMPLAVLAGLGGEALRSWLAGLTPAGREPARDAAASGFPVTALLLILLLSWMKFVPLVRTVGQEAWGARHDHQYARDFIKKIPPRSLVVTHIPTMFLLSGQNAIQAFAGINNPDLIRDLMTRYNGHVYFHFNYWCNTPNDSNQKVCDGIRANYNLEPVAVAREQSFHYGLYRMTFK